MTDQPDSPPPTERPVASPPDPNASSGGGDVWDRLRQLEDLERGPIPAERRAAPPPERSVLGDRTVVGPVASAAAPAAARAAAPAAAPAPAPATPTAAAAARGRDAYRDAGQPPRRPAPTRDPGGDAPGGRPPKRRRSGKRWYRPKWRWLFLYLPLLIMLSILGVGAWGWSQFNDLYRVDMGDSITGATGGAVNYLIVGSDSRDGINADTPNVGAIGTGTEVTGRRSDTIIILRVDGSTATMMSIPRDLWVTNVQTGKKGRINGTYAQGPPNLARTITANLGIPINRYVEVDFVSFAGMVDAMGGIDIDFAHPVIDPNSGLKIATAGTHKLDGTMALAYVRSRHYTEEIDGKPVLEPTADLGRQQRQQNFIRTVLHEVGQTRNPLTLAKVATAAAKGVRVDTEVGFFDLVSLARQLSGADPATKVLPTHNANKGGAAVLELNDAEARPILSEFGAP